MSELSRKSYTERMADCKLFLQIIRGKTNRNRHLIIHVHG